MRLLATPPSLQQLLSLLALSMVSGFVPFVILIASIALESEALSIVAYVCMGVLFLVWGLGVASVFLLPIHSTRSWAIRLSTIAVGIAPTVLLGGLLLGTVESRQLNNAIASGQGVAEGVVKYTTDHGTAPTDLKELIPRYLDKLPEHPRNLRIISDTDTPLKFEGNAWVLRSEANVLMSEDSGYYLVYFPNKNYPQATYRKIGEWAVHNPS